VWLPLLFAETPACPSRPDANLRDLWWPFRSGRIEPGDLSDCDQRSAEKLSVQSKTWRVPSSLSPSRSALRFFMSTKADGRRESKTIADYLRSMGRQCYGMPDAFIRCMFGISSHQPGDGRENKSLLTGLTETGTATPHSRRGMSRIAWIQIKRRLRDEIAYCAQLYFVRAVHTRFLSPDALVRAIDRRVILAAFPIQRQ